jgi:hypothetical protein
MNLATSAMGEAVINEPVGGFGLMGWPEVDSTRTPNVEGSPAQASPRVYGRDHHSQLVFEVAQLLSAYWLPGMALGAGAALFETELAGLSVVANTAEVGKRRFLPIRPGGGTSLTIRRMWNSTMLQSTVVTYFTDEAPWAASQTVFGPSYFNPIVAYTGEPAVPAGNFIVTVPNRQVEAPTSRRDSTDPTRTEPWTKQTVTAIQDLKAWLNLTTEEVARLVGASKGAVYYWQRVGGEPRAQVGRKIARVHSLLQVLRSATTPPGFQAILRAKPQGYNRSAFDLLMNHEFDRAETLLHEYVFARPRNSEPYWARQVSEWPRDSDPVPAAASPSLRPPRRTRRRVKLRKRD